MRLLVFSERLAPPPDEGIKKLALSLAAALRRLGHEVLTLTTAGADWPEMAVTNIPADRLLRAPALAARITAFRPDAALYIPTASLTLASGLRARMLRLHARSAPVVLVATQGRQHSALVRIVARLVAPDLCAVQSRHTEAQARSLGWRTFPLPPSVDARTFCPASAAEKIRLRTAYGLPGDAFIALHVGHLNRRRGVASLAALADLALPLLAASISTPQDATLADELQAAGVRLVTRYVPQVQQIYQAADVYVFPTPPAPGDPSSIDWPLSVLEAAACGLPILTTRFGALPETWSDEPGVAFYNDIASLRAGLVRLRDHPASTRPLAERLSWEAAARQMLEALRTPRT